MPEYGRVGNVTPLRLKFDSSVRNGVTTVTLTRPRAFRSSAITVKEYDAEREHNHGPDEERSRPAHTHTHIHGGGWWCRGTAHTRAHGTGAPAAPSHRSVGPSPSLSRAHGTVNPPAECCCSHRQALRTSADAPRARQDDAQSPPLRSFVFPRPNRCRAGTSLLRTGRPTPPEFGTRLPLHSSAGAALRASPTMRREACTPMS